MSKPTHIQEFGNNRVVLRSNGKKELFLTTGGSLWLNSNAPDFEMPVGSYGKTVVNPNIDVFFGQKEVLWAVSSGDNIVACARIASGSNPNRSIFYSADGGVSWSTSDAPVSNTNYDWVKVIDGFIYTGGDNLMLSQDNGATWTVVFASIILGIAKGNGVYVANSARWNEVFPGAISSDGITFSINAVTINHIDGSSVNGFGDIFNQDVEFYNGLFYSFLTEHNHTGPNTNSTPKKYFTSSNGIIWNESITPITTRNVNAPMWVVNNVLVDTPNKENNGIFYINSGGGLGTQIEGDYSVAYENVVDFGAGQWRPIKDQWIHYADGVYWVGKNYNDVVDFATQFKRSEICISNVLNSTIFTPVTIASEFDWYISAQVVHEDKYYAFERQTIQPASSISARTSSAITRLVRMDNV